MEDGSTEDRWTLAPAEREWVMRKNRANRLGFAILLTFFRERGRFPRDETEVEVQDIAVLSRQLDVPIPLDGKAFLTGRTAERLRSEIRLHFGFREATVVDADMLAAWLRDHVAAEVGGEVEPMTTNHPDRNRPARPAPGLKSSGAAWGRSGDRRGCLQWRGSDGRWCRPGWGLEPVFAQGNSVSASG